MQKWCMPTNSMKTQDLSMTYLGQTKMTRDTKIKAEEKFPITGQGFASGKLLDGTECQILLDTGATKSYMSKLYFSTCITQILFKYPKNSRRKWTICQCIVCYPSDCRHTWT